MTELATELGEAMDNDEVTITEEILGYNRGLMRETKGGVKLRAQHPKHHGLVDAVFEIRNDIPARLRTGLFAVPKTYKALIRFSNGGKHDDRLSDAHGMAIKLLGVPGEKLDPVDSEDHGFDFILIDHPVMFAETLSQYRAASELLHDVAEIDRSGSNSLFDKLQKAIEAGEMVLEGGLGLLGRLKAFASHRPSSPLKTHYWSQTPFLLGDGLAVKYMAQSEVLAVQPEEEGDDPDLLRKALASELAGGPVRFTFGVHVQEDVQRHPVEDSTSLWWPGEDPGGVASMLPVADITLTGLSANTERAESIAFSAWNVTAEHRPLGVLNRVRRAIYGRLAEIRNGSA